MREIIEKNKEELAKAYDQVIEIIEKNDVELTCISDACNELEKGLDAQLQLHEYIEEILEEQDGEIVYPGPHHRNSLKKWQKELKDKYFILFEYDEYDRMYTTADCSESPKDYMSSLTHASIVPEIVLEDITYWRDVDIKKYKYINKLAKQKIKNWMQAIVIIAFFVTGLYWEEDFDEINWNEYNNLAKKLLELFF